MHRGCVVPRPRIRRSNGANTLFLSQLHRACGAAKVLPSIGSDALLLQPAVWADALACASATMRTRVSRAAAAPALSKLRRTTHDACSERARARLRRQQCYPMFGAHSTPR